MDADTIWVVIHGEVIKEAKVGPVEEVPGGFCLSLTAEEMDADRVTVVVSRGNRP